MRQGEHIDTHPRHRRSSQTSTPARHAEQPLCIRYDASVTCTYLGPLLAESSRERCSEDASQCMSALPLPERRTTSWP